MHALPIALALAAMLLIGPAAQQQPAPPSNSISAEEASMQGFGDADKTCQEWTDACMTCRRGENGDPLCPNIGIACVPKAITCAKRAEPAK